MVQGGRIPPARVQGLFFQVGLVGHVPPAAPTGVKGVFFQVGLFGQTPPPTGLVVLGPTRVKGVFPPMGLGGSCPLLLDGTWCFGSSCYTTGCTSQY